MELLVYMKLLTIPENAKNFLLSTKVFFLSFQKFCKSTSFLCINLLSDINFVEYAMSSFNKTSFKFLF